MLQSGPEEMIEEGVSSYRRVVENQEKSSVLSFYVSGNLLSLLNNAELESIT